MSDHDDSSEFERRTRQALLASAERLDAATRSKLTRARHSALAAGSKPAWLDLRRLAPVGVAASAVLATVLYLGRGDGGASDSASTLYDMELLADVDALALAEEEDYEFIEWAVAMNRQAGAGT